MIEYKNAEEIFENGDYELAFKEFKQIAQDESNRNSIRAESYNMMGAIINGFAPYLDDKNDETGLKHFLNAIEFDENNIGALLNIVNTFGEDPSMHNNIDVFEKAYKKLVGDLSNKISADELIRLKKKHGG